MINPKYHNLKKGKLIGKVYIYKGDEWKLENLRDGFMYFKGLNGYYPTLNDIDNFD